MTPPVLSAAIADPTARITAVPAVLRTPDVVTSAAADNDDGRMEIPAAPRLGAAPALARGLDEPGQVIRVASRDSGSGNSRPIQSAATAKRDAARARAATLQNNLTALQSAVTNGLGERRDQPYTGRTATTAAEVRGAAQRLAALQRDVQGLLSDIDRQQPGMLGRMFRGDGAYDALLKALNEPSLSVRRGSQLYRLLAPNSSAATTNVSFDAAMSAVEQLMTRSAEQARDLREAGPKAARALTAASEQLERVRASLAGDDSAAFNVANLAGTNLPVIAQLIETARGEAVRDPLTVATDTATTQALALAERLISASAQARTALAGPIATQRNELERLRANTAWIATRTDALTASGRAVAGRAQLDEAAVAGHERELRGFPEQVARVTSLARAKPLLLEELDRGDQSAAQARDNLARRLSLPASALLSEPGLSPFEALRDARARTGDMSQAVDRGDDNAAAEARAAAGLALQNAAGWIGAASASVDGNEKAAADVRNRIAQVTAAIPERDAVVQRLATAYAGKEVVEPERARIVDSTEKLRQATADLAKAQQEYGRGAVIGGARLLAGARNALETAAKNLDAVAATEQNLAKLDRDNATAAPRLLAKARELVSQAGTERTQASTRETLSQLLRQAEALAPTVAVAGRNPVVIAEHFAALQTVVNDGPEHLAADARNYAAALAAIAAAESALSGTSVFIGDGGWRGRLAQLRALLARGNFVDIANEAGSIRATIDDAIAREIARLEAERRAREEEERRRREAESTPAPSPTPDPTPDPTPSSPSSSDGFGGTSPSSNDGF